jgi:hypothetical protein
MAPWCDDRSNPATRGRTVTIAGQTVTVNRSPASSPASRCSTRPRSQTPRPTAASGPHRRTVDVPLRSASFVRRDGDHELRGTFSTCSSVKTLRDGIDGDIVDTCGQAQATDDGVPNPRRSADDPPTGGNGDGDGGSRTQPALSVRHHTLRRRSGRPPDLQVCRGAGLKACGTIEPR